MEGSAAGFFRRQREGEARSAGLGLQDRPCSSYPLGFIVSAISCRHGFFAVGGARGVGVATTRAVVESCVTLLIVNYLLTQVLLDADI